MRSKRSLKAAAGAVLLAGATALALAGTAPARAATAASGNFTGTLANGTTWVADVPANWNGTLLLYSHGFGPLTAADAPDPGTQAALLARGYALAGSSYDPNGSEWALDTAVSDQFGTLAAVEGAVLPRRPSQVLAFGTSMGGLVSALEAQDGGGRINGALTTCGIVAGGINLNEFQLDGEYAMAQLLLPGQQVQLVNFGGSGGASQAAATAATLTAAATQAQQTAAGRARLALALAFLNAAPWDPSATAPAPGTDPAAQEAAQYDLEFTGSFSILDFIELGRASIDQADGGSANWNAGVHYASVLARSPFRSEVASLYKAAGLNLGADLANLTRNANITADPAAVRSLEQTSVPTGTCPCRNSTSTRSATTSSPWKWRTSTPSRSPRPATAACSGRRSPTASATATSARRNSSPASSPSPTGSPPVTGTGGRPSSLNQVAASLDLGPAQFAEDYYPGPLTGATRLHGGSPGRR